MRVFLNIGNNYSLKKLLVISSERITFNSASTANQTNVEDLKKRKFDVLVIPVAIGNLSYLTPS